MYKRFTSILLTILGLISNQTSWAQSDQNTVLGYMAGSPTMTGTNNTFLGANSGLGTQSGSYNVFLGSSVGNANTSGSYNSFIGYLTGIKNTSGVGNSFLGAGSGSSNIDGSYNLFIGNGTGLKNTSGGYNTFIGINSGYNNLTGNRNVFIGTESGLLSTQGTDNVFIGNSSGYSNTGTSNIAIGVGAAYGGAGGGSNISIGQNSGYNISSGSGNVSIGPTAGFANTTGSNNTYLGVGAGLSSPSSLSNAVAIGAYAQVANSNAIVLGSSLAKVGIGAINPQNKLEITHGTAGNSGLRFTNLTSATTPTASTNQFLTVNTNGDVVLALVGSSKGSFRSATTIDSVSLWTSDGLHLRNSNSQGGVVIGPGVANTPAGYRLYVADGVLTEKVKVAIKSSADWSDYVFAPDYKLAPLAEVAKHIQQKGHLPGIPSAREMVEKGNDLHQTDAKLLAKIEELTLYTIQLEKSDQAKQQKLNKQQAKLDELEKLVKKLLEKK